MSLPRVVLHGKCYLATGKKINLWISLSHKEKCDCSSELQVNSPVVYSFSFFSKPGFLLVFVVCDVSCTVLELHKLYLYFFYENFFSLYKFLADRETSTLDL